MTTPPPQRHRTSALDPDAERRKLAHTLGVDAAELGMLAAVPAEDVRILRTQVAEALFQADRHHFARIASLTRAAPVAVTAKLTEAALPPLIAARTAELLEPARAVEMVGKLSPRYVADVAAAMDASRAPEVVRAMPPTTVVAVSDELAGRGEWVVMGAFVALVSEPALRAAVAALDGGQLLRISFFLEDTTRLDTIGAMLTDDQLDEMLRSAAADRLWPELGELVAHLSPQRLARLAGRFQQLDDAVRQQFQEAAAGQQLRQGAYDALTA